MTKQKFEMKIWIVLTIDYIEFLLFNMKRVFV